MYIRVLSESPNSVLITLRPYMPLEPRYPHPHRPATVQDKDGSRVQGLGVSVCGFRVSGLGCRVQCSGFRD